MKRLDVVLEKSRVLACKPLSRAPRYNDRVHGDGHSSDAFGIIARRLSLIIALLVLIILVLLASLETGSGANIKRTYRQIAESKLPIGGDSRNALIGDQDGNLGVKG